MVRERARERVRDVTNLLLHFLNRLPRLRAMQVATGVEAEAKGVEAGERESMCDTQRFTWKRHSLVQTQELIRSFRTAVRQVETPSLRISNIQP